MARNRQNLNIIYISDRMRETLRPIASCALTAVVAPMGYGKTTAVRWFLAEQAKAGAVVLQASIYSDNRSIFWKSVQKAFAAAGLTVLEGYDCPADASGAALLLEDLCAALGGKTPYYLFLDDFHLLGDERVAQFLCRLAYRLPENVHLIVASRNRFLPGEQVVRLGRRLHRIEADGLRLNREELLAYTHRCGVEITAAQAESLLRSCEGWFSAVYLNLHALAERGSLLQLGSDIYAMFTAAMLESLPEKTRGFLAVMGLADEFTVEMARAVTALPDAEEVLRALTQQNAFVTRLPDGVSFRFHHMMKECAERLFAQLPAARQTEVWQRYGRWYAQKAQYLHALQAFEHCGDRDAALAVIEADAGDLLASLSPAELLQRAGPLPGGSAAAPPAGHSGADAPDVHLAADPQNDGAESPAGSRRGPTPRVARRRAGQPAGGVRPHPELLVLQRHHPDEPPPPQRQPPDEPPRRHPAQQRQLDLRLPLGADDVLPRPRGAGQRTGRNVRVYAPLL